MLKYCPPFIQELLVLLFNLCYKHGIFPESWSRAFIAPLHKKGNMLDPMNYRGLALSSCISKVYTAVLNTRLYQTMSAHNMHRTWQGGFTKNKRTTDNIFLLNTIRERAKKTHKTLYCLFLDLTKAYDCVSRTKLRKIMENNHFDQHLIQAIMSSMVDTEYAVKKDGCRGPYFRTYHGLKQGDSLSPLLFNLYMHA